MTLERQKYVLELAKKHLAFMSDCNQYGEVIEDAIDALEKQQLIRNYFEGLCPDLALAYDGPENIPADEPPCCWDGAKKDVLEILNHVSSPEGVAEDEDSQRYFGEDYEDGED